MPKFHKLPSESAQEEDPYEEQQQASGGTMMSAVGKMMGGSSQTTSEVDDFKRRVYLHMKEQNIGLDKVRFLKVLEMTSDEYDYMLAQHRATISAGEEPLSWDYVFAFNVAKDDDVRMPSKKEKEKMPDEEAGMREWEEGMPKQEYYGQVMMVMKDDLERAGFQTRTFVSRDKQYAFIICALTESGLRVWADQRDTDLEIEPIEAVKEGRKHDMPLALRTPITDEEQPADEDKGKKRLLLENWEGMHIKYDQHVNPLVYKQFDRLPGNPDSIKTPFSEKTRLRLLQWWNGHAHFKRTF